MNLTELQILFQQKIQDTNPVFEVQQRPDTFTICNYLNRSIDKYLEKKYLALPTYEQRLSVIDMNYDELHNLITSHGVLTYNEAYPLVSPFPRSLSEYNWNDRGKRYRTTDDVLIPISITCTITRTEVYALTGQKIFAQWMSRRQAEKLISNSSDKVMYPKPIAVWEDPYSIMVIGDAYTTSISADQFTYLRKPYKLDYNYYELKGSLYGGSCDISSIPTDTWFLAKSYLTYVDRAGTTTNYKPGDKIIKVYGYNTITSIDVPNNEQVIVSYPWGYTDTPDFPTYLHDSIVDMAVSLFLDEAKFKLITKT
jgi:hypothetical protein